MIELASQLSQAEIMLRHIIVAWIAMITVVVTMGCESQSPRDGSAVIPGVIFRVQHATGGTIYSLHQAESPSRQIVPARYSPDGSVQTLTIIDSAQIIHGRIYQNEDYGWFVLCYRGDNLQVRSFGDKGAMDALVEQLCESDDRDCSEVRSYVLPGITLRTSEDRLDNS